jgi:trimeric autotransporter adhesin
MTNSAERMRIDSSGNVGIGTSSPTNPLHVVGEGTFTRGLELGINGVDATSYITQYRATVETFIGPATTRMLLGTVSNHDIAIHTNNTERLRITDTGLVGIGNAAPSYLLDLYKAAGTVARIRNTAATGATPNASYGELVIESTDASMGMQFLGSTTADQRILFSDTAASSGQIVYNHTSNYMALFTNAAERMRIDSSGNVGIGVTTVDTALGTKLHVAGTIRTDTGSAGANPAIVFDHDNFADADANSIVLDRTSEAMRFTVNASERMRIDSSGNVGIGTSSPVQKLDVSGNLAVTSVYASGVASTASTPTYTWGGQQTVTGMYLPSDRTIAFSTNAAERMRIDSSGNVGIGTSAPLVQS